MKKEEKKIKWLYDVAKLYYEEHFSQDEISDFLKVSRATVSRGLTEAEERGIVHIAVIDQLGISSKIAQQIEKKYSLSKAIIAHAPYKRRDIIKKNIGREAAKYISEVIGDKQSVGIAWGTTLYEMVKSLNPMDVNSLDVIELTGSIGHISSEFAASELARIFAEKFGARRFVLQAPALVSSVEIKNAMLLDKNISEVIEMGKNVDVAIIGIGSIDCESPVYKTLNLKKSDIDEIIAANVVGDICFRFFDDKGNKIKLPFDERIIGIELDDFKKIGTRIGIAGGENKIMVIKAALLGSLINVLITDNFTANELL